MIKKKQKDRISPKDLRWAALVCVIAVILGVIITLSASAQTSFLYYTDITIHNTNAFPVTSRIAFPMSSLTLVSNGYIKSTASDTNLTYNGSDTQLMATNLATNASNWYTGIITLPALSNSVYRLYMGDISYNRDQDLSSLRSDVVSIAHNANLNFTNMLGIGASVTWLTSAPTATQYFFNKPGQYALGVDATSGYFFTVVTNNPPTPETLTPNGIGNYAFNALFGAPTNWQANLTDDGDTSYVGTVGDAFTRTDTYNITNSTASTGASGKSVTVYAVAKQTGGLGNLWLRVRLNGIDSIGPSNLLTGSYATYSYSFVRPGGGTWTIADINNLEIGFDLNDGNTPDTRVTQVYAVIDYQTIQTITYPLTLSTSVYAAGFYVYTTSPYNINIQGVGINGSTYTTAALYGLVATSTSTAYWQFDGRVDEITVGDGIFNVYANYKFEPNQITTNTVIDQSAYANNASVTWTGNPSGVTVSVGYLQVQGGGAIVGGETTITIGSPPMLATITYVNSGSSTVHTDIFGYDFVAGLINNMGLPANMISIPYIILFSLALIVIPFFCYKWFKTMFMTAIIVGVILAIAWQLGVFPWWFLLADVPIALIGIIVDKRNGVIF